jgi:hypothetical protein
MGGEGSSTCVVLILTRKAIYNVAADAHAVDVLHDKNGVSTIIPNPGHFKLRVVTKTVPSAKLAEKLSLALVVALVREFVLHGLRQTLVTCVLCKQFTHSNRFVKEKTLGEQLARR